MSRTGQLFDKIKHYQFAVEESSPNRCGIIRFAYSFFLEFENSANVIAFFVKVAEMETILQEHNNTMPAREVLVGLAEKFRCVPS